MKRVMIIGQPGSGKTTTARQLGAVTGLPIVHVDRIYWQEGWRERPVAQRKSLAEAAAKEDRWIIEGGMSSTWERRIARADTLIFLDTPFPLRIWRVFRRTIRHYGKTRPDLPDNCPERFSPEFWRFIWRTRHRSRARMTEAAARAKDTGVTDVHVIKGRRSWDRFLAARRPLAESVPNPVLSRKGAM